jgi:GNAT superfamily N-acetyltransferase
VTSAPQISLSAIDEERFGIRTARVSGVIPEQLPAILAFCQQKAVVFLIARCAAADLRAAQAMEAHGFQLMDTLLYYARDLMTTPIPPLPDGVIVEPISPGDADTIRELAASAFRGYGGHYHADARLDPAKCDETYVSWAYRSCITPGVADVVLKAVVAHQIAGFITLRMNNPQEGEVPLYGVDAAVQGRGIGRGLVIGALAWCQSQGAQRMKISTQVTNVPSQKVWVRLGFEPMDAYYTFHKWFD